MNTPKLDDKGQLYEYHEFKTGGGYWAYSDKLHKLQAICNLYGLDFFTWTGFLKADRILNDQTK